MALLQTRSEAGLPAKTTKVWLGEGLGSVAKKTQEKMWRWEFIDLGELRPRNPLDKVPQESDTQRLVVLPGFEVAQAKQKPIGDIITWTHCYARYTAAMSTKFPRCTGGFMAHLVTVLKAYTEAEEPAWRLYDEAFREKMAATGCREWPGMDIHLYQEVCMSRLRRGRHLEPTVLGTGTSAAGGKNVGGASAGVKRPRTEEQLQVCWLFNSGRCHFKQCKFTHVCSFCQGPHPKMRCPRQGGMRNGGTGHYPPPAQY